MADGWRNWFRAPVCALGISFVLAFILGFALKYPTRIQFLIADWSGSSEPAKELKDHKIEFFTTGKDRKSLGMGLLNQLGEFTLQTPYAEIQICATLPEDKFAVNPKLTGANGESCWQHLALGEDVVITLVRKV